MQNVIPVLPLVRRAIIVTSAICFKIKIGFKIFHSVNVDEIELKCVFKSSSASNGSLK